MKYNIDKIQKNAPEEVAEAWNSYLNNRDDEISRVLLVEFYQPFVQQVARRYSRKKPFLMDHDDITQAGNLGLIQALARYDPSREQTASFKTFALRRVNGSILDTINKLDWTPRDVHENIMKILKAEAQIIQEHGEINIPAIMEITGFTEKQVILAQSQALRTYILPVAQESLEEIENNLDVESLQRAFVGLMDSFGGESSLINSIDNSLSDLEKQVILLRFFYVETMISTAKILGITSNKVSSIQKEALSKLRKTYERHH